MILKYKNFLQLSNFQDNQIDESAYFSGNLNESEYAPTDPNLKAYWDKFASLREKQISRIKKCVTMVVGKFPFFGDFLQTSRFVWDHPEIDTMATDGANIFISSEFCSVHTEEQLVFVLVHEVMHITLLHHFRYKEHGAKNSLKWNYAGDYEINPYCVGLGIITKEEILAMKGLYEDKYVNMPVELIYDKIPDPPKQPKKPKQKQPKQPPIEPTVGDYIKIKNGGGYGKITGKNPDGSWQVEQVTREEVSQAMK